MSVYVYARQSSGDEDRSISVEQQVANCEHLAEQMNLKVDETFQDLNTSGRLYWSGAENLAQLDFVFQKWIKETKKTNQFRTGLGDLLTVAASSDDWAERIVELDSLVACVQQVDEVVLPDTEAQTAPFVIELREYADQHSV